MRRGGTTTSKAQEPADEVPWRIRYRSEEKEGGKVRGVVWGGEGGNGCGGSSGRGGGEGFGLGRRPFGFVRRSTNCIRHFVPIASTGISICQTTQVLLNIHQPPSSRCFFFSFSLAFLRHPLSTASVLHGRVGCLVCHSSSVIDESLSIFIQKGEERQFVRYVFILWECYVNTSILTCCGNGIRSTQGAANSMD